MMNMSDLLVSHQGSSIFLLMGVSEAGDNWIEEHIPEDAQTWGGAIVVDGFSYIAPIIEGAQRDGRRVGGLSHFRPMS
jgi:hypothetical protein